MSTRTHERTRIYVDLPFHLIQSFRLIHALSETGVEICVHEADVPKFQLLRERFNVEVDAAEQGQTPLPRLRIQHDAPRTEVGDIVRPLIFPLAIFDYCRSMWPEERDITYLFRGLVTPARHALLSAWLKLQRSTYRLPSPPASSMMNRLRRRILGTELSTEYTDSISVGGGLFQIASNVRGRKFPIKAWDDDYFRTMSRAKFVLCPRGDYAWTYRFFEATMCGAIPLVEEPCAHYASFRYQDINTPVRDLTWSRDDVEHNFSVCHDLLTVPTPILDWEVQQLLRVHEMGTTAGLPRDDAKSMRQRL
jgi:hypothetical protein